MALLSKKSLPLLLILVVLIFKTQQECLNLSYLHQLSATQYLDISYFQCSESSYAVFTSCKFFNKQTQETKELSESQCFHYCYPQMQQEIKVPEIASQKPKIEQKKETLSTGMQQLLSQEFQRQLQKEQREVDRTIHEIGIGCMIFTIVSILVIIRCLDSKEPQQLTIRTRYSDKEQNSDLPDINVDSGLTYSVEVGGYPRKLVI